MQRCSSICIPSRPWHPKDQGLQNSQNSQEMQQTNTNWKKTSKIISVWKKRTYKHTVLYFVEYPGHGNLESTCFPMLFEVAQVFEQCWEHPCLRLRFDKWGPYSSGSPAGIQGWLASTLTPVSPILTTLETLRIFIYNVTAMRRHSRCIVSLPYLCQRTLSISFNVLFHQLLAPLNHCLTGRPVQATPVAESTFRCRNCIVNRHCEQRKGHDESWHVFIHGFKIIFVKVGLISI